MKLKIYKIKDKVYEFYLILKLCFCGYSYFEAKKSIKKAIFTGESKGIDIGKKEGIDIGKKEEKISIAQNMLNKKFAIKK